MTLNVNNETHGFGSSSLQSFQFGVKLAITDFVPCLQVLESSRIHQISVGALLNIPGINKDQTQADGNGITITCTTLKH